MKSGAVDRMACVDLPALPLQLLLKRHPDWAERPTVVVDRDKPQGMILWVNEHARAHRIRPGMRYATGLSLARTLHAGEVPVTDIEHGVETIVGRLRRFSPEVEPCHDEPGVFWLDASGLSQLYASPRQWAQAIDAMLRQLGFRAAIVVGFTRFGTYACARGTGVSHARQTARSIEGNLTIIGTLDQERALAGQVPLDRLGIEPGLQESLRKLGVQTVRAFLHLPGAGVRRRFGAEAYRLHRLASGDLWAPLRPKPVETPLVRRLDFDDPETDLSRVLFAVKRLLDQLLRIVMSRGEVVSELTLDLRLDRDGARSEQIRPAAPTGDVGQLMNLVRLRFESQVLCAGIIEIRLAARAVCTQAAQPGLFAEPPRRDLAAANRALARIRAEFGNEVVVRARLTEGHLPEARFEWERFGTLVPASPRAVSRRSLVRRIHARAIQLPPRPRHEPDGWLVRGGVTGHVRDLSGPYLISGGWWRTAVHREYYFAQMRDGDVLWIYYDRPRRRWCWQGQVE